MTSVSLKNITKQWGGFIGVDNQSLEIQHKEFLVLLGPSGCGKTTTMRMIAGLETPSSGEIWIGEKYVNHLSPKDRDIAMVFQNYGLYPHMSIFDNIAYPLRVRKTPKIDIKPRVLKAAEQVELSDHLSKKPRELSGGQRQRVALARAIVRKPQVFLMDEPLSNLDAKLRVSMRAELKHLSRQLQITTIYVTHDQIEAMTLADRIAIMKDGKIQQLGTPDTIFNQPANMFVAGFIGSPAMNLIHGAIQDKHFVSEQGVVLCPVNAPDRPHTSLGIRADDLILSPQEKSDVKLPVYAFENTGENSLITLKVDPLHKIVARTDRHVQKKENELVHIRFSREHIYFFDTLSQERILNINPSSS